jgi:hypothetical protein
MTDKQRNLQYANTFVALINQFTKIHKDLSDQAVQFAKRTGRGFLVVHSVIKTEGGFTYKDPNSILEELKYYPQQKLKLITANVDTNIVQQMRKLYNEYDPIHELVICFVFEQETKDINFLRVNLYTPPAKKYFGGMERQQQLIQQQLALRQLAMKQSKCANLGCKSTNADKQCSRCKAVKYCSKTCQVEDWNRGHKKTCIVAK